MSQDRETNLALFIDFDNVALGARDARQRFDIKLILDRLLEKGKIIVKKAYADWHYYKEHMSPLHEAAIELIEIPMPRISGKNSADIRLVVDAMDMCYAKEHIDTFAIISGDSDFSPLVSKLRENNKRVIGIGMKNSSSKLLIGNCDEFIFYDDLYRQTRRRLGGSAVNVPDDKRELFDFLVKTVQSLLQENRGVLYSSLIKDTMTRKEPAFSERSHGFSTFGDLLDEARKLGLLMVERDAAAGGTWVVHGLGADVEGVAASEKPSNGGSRSSRRRRRSGRGSGSGERPTGDKSATEATSGRDTQEQSSSRETEKVPDGAERRDTTAKQAAETKSDSGLATKAQPGEPRQNAKKPNKKTGRKPAADGRVSKKAPAKKAATKKTATKKPVTKKATAAKAGTKKTVSKKAATKKTATNKTVAKKPVTKKAATKKSTAKKTAKKAVKKTVRKTTKKAAPKK